MSLNKISESGKTIARAPKKKTHPVKSFYNSFTLDYILGSGPTTRVSVFHSSNLQMLYLQPLLNDVSRSSNETRRCLCSNARCYFLNSGEKATALHGCKKNHQALLELSSTFLAPSSPG